MSVIGKAAPETVKPLPVIASELTVTGPVPVEVRMTGSVADEPSPTEPDAHARSDSQKRMCILEETAFPGERRGGKMGDSSLGVRRSRETRRSAIR